MTSSREIWYEERRMAESVPLVSGAFLRSDWIERRIEIGLAIPCRSCVCLRGQCSFGNGKGDRNQESSHASSSLGQSEWTNTQWHSKGDSSSGQCHNWRWSSVTIPIQNTDFIVDNLRLAWSAWIVSGRIWSFFICSAYSMRVRQTHCWEHLLVIVHPIVIFLHRFNQILFLSNPAFHPGVAFRIIVRMTPQIGFNSPMQQPWQALPFQNIDSNYLSLSSFCFEYRYVFLFVFLFEFSLVGEDLAKLNKSRRMFSSLFEPMRQSPSSLPTSDDPPLIPMAQRLLSLHLQMARGRTSHTSHAWKSSIFQPFTRIVEYLNSTVLAQ